MMLSGWSLFQTDALKLVVVVRSPNHIEVVNNFLLARSYLRLPHSVLCVCQNNDKVAVCSQMTCQN